MSLHLLSLVFISLHLLSLVFISLHLLSLYLVPRTSYYSAYIAEAGYAAQCLGATVSNLSPTMAPTMYMPTYAPTRSVFPDHDPDHLRQYQSLQIQ